ncbi:hypothetical protein SAMN00120144_2124 [Hymenobacter roseosalivarius DSM 11622]|uniref:Uncharacterized protein n=1 Tax=Hymenobacter roseosalivarius DSM 11622 TaxID=645990 RepID=A0A1W1VFS5_9BACT|nr:hypothetical protein SAMN00120144_2124 [Hymenobacter roseosalivarius DSM 11622]
MGRWQGKQGILPHLDALLAQVFLQEAIEFAAAHAWMLLAHVRNSFQDILLALLTAPLPRFVLIIGLSAKPKYSADPPQAKVRTADS